MKLIVKCFDCNAENKAPNKSDNRIDYAKQFGDNFNLRCIECGHANDYQVDDIVAVDYGFAELLRNSAIVLLVILVASMTIGIIVTDVRYGVLLSGGFTLISTFLIKRNDVETKINFNKHKLKGRISSINFIEKNKIEKLADRHDSAMLYDKTTKDNSFIVRNAKPGEFDQIGQLLVDVYSSLEGFPKPGEQPAYYQMLAAIGEQTKKPDTELLVAVSGNQKPVGAVVYFSDMKQYGSGGTATQERNASGFRLLAVDPLTRGQGIGKLLTLACIEKAKEKNHRQLIIHSTKAMQTAWNMYENLGFKRSEDLDFMQGNLPVYGFRLIL